MEGTREKWLYRGTQIVWYALWVIEAFLVLRFILRLLGANASAWFTQFIYSVSGFFHAPFQFILPQTTAPVVTGSVFEWSTVIAIIVYWLIAIGVVRLLSMGGTISNEEARARLEKKDK